MKRLNNIKALVKKCNDVYRRYLIKNIFRKETFKDVKKYTDKEDFIVSMYYFYIAKEFASLPTSQEYAIEAYKNDPVFQKLCDEQIRQIKRMISREI